jgi:hypothetical protein
LNESSRTNELAYQGSILGFGDNVGLMDKDIIRGGRIVTGGGDESKALSVGEPFDRSFDFFRRAYDSNFLHAYDFKQQSN